MKKNSTKSKDEIKSAIYDLLGHGIQFDIDCIMNLMIANKPVVAKQKLANIKPKIEALDILLNQLIHERTIKKINYKNS